MKNIERLFNVVNRSLFRIDGNLDYERTTQAIIKLCSAINDYDGESESLWYLGEFGDCMLDDLIAGAFWHYTEYHGGQYSIGYAALSALGSIYDPGMESGVPDNPAYQELQHKFNELKQLEE